MAIKEFLGKYVYVHKCASVAEAKQQKKDRLQILKLSGILAAVYVVLTMIPLGFFNTLANIVFFPFLICFIAGVWTSITAHNEYQRLLFVLCKQCGNKFDLDDVKYEFLSERRSTGSPNKQGHIPFTVFHRYKFVCTCAKCGQTASFGQDFVQNKGNIKGETVVNENPVNVENAIKKFFE